MAGELGAELDSATIGDDTSTKRKRVDALCQIHSLALRASIHDASHQSGAVRLAPTVANSLLHMLGCLRLRERETGTANSRFTGDLFRSHAIELRP